MIELAEQWRGRGLHTDERIGWGLTRAAERWPHRTALVFEDERLTYRDLWRWVTSTARWFHGRGLRPGDRLLWQVDNCVEAVVAHLAAWRIGLVCVPVVGLYREHEMAHILAEAQPAAVLTAARRSDRYPARELDALLAGGAATPRVRLVVGGEVPGWTGIPSRPGRDTVVSDVGLPDPTAAGDDCLVLYTSGTTSSPKGARHASRSLLAEASTWRATYGFTSSDCFFMGAPLAHIAGLLATLVLPATVGATAVLLPGWDPDRAVEIAERERATFCVGATVFLQDLVTRYEQGRAPGHRIGLFMCGGAAVPSSLVERADALGITAFRVWGMTEVPTVTLASPEDPLERRARFDGRRSEGTEILAVDQSGRPVPDGTPGELWVRSPEQMLGYLDAASTAAQVTDEGWFATGDIGTVDPEGWVTIVGRAKDIVNRGGEKFSCQDIERAIGDHPAVDAVAVLGVPDERLGEQVAAFIVVTDGATWPGEAALLAHLEGSRLAKQKFPRHWQVVESLPMTLSGKVQKHQLLDRWLLARGERGS